MLPFRGGINLALYHKNKYDSPLELPSTNGLALWVADDGITKSGLLVNSWVDQFAGIDITQSGAACPSLIPSVPALNYKPALLFSGAQYLVKAVASGLVANRNVYSVYMVFISSSAASTIKVLYAEGNTSIVNPIANGWVNYNAAGKVSWFHRNDAGGGIADPISADLLINDNSAHILTIRRTAASAWSLRLDGTEVATETTNPTITTIDRIAIGAQVRAAVQYYHTGYIACVALYSSDNYTAIEPLLGEHYGVALPPF